MGYAAPSFVKQVKWRIGLSLCLRKQGERCYGFRKAGDMGGFALQADNGDYRGLLAGLEGVSGKKVVVSDSMTVKN